MSLDSKVALVTGASRGIGRAVAIKLAQCGANVIVNYANNKTQADETLALMGAHQKKSCSMGFDVSDETAVEKSIEAIKNDFGSIDILVNNAGIAVDGLIMRLKSEDFERQININLKGAFNCTKACSKYMMKNRYGKIVNISSVVGQMGNAGQSVYAAAKAGLIGMTKSLARELASRNILVNAVTPGYIATDMTKDILQKGMENVLEQIPLKRVGLPQDIANAVAFLVSDQSDYITGQVLSVNGGLYI
ncbi:MAG: 3-oxoacyl-[acyl-carrier-protein] reductase [Myxococcales bacterium]|nr:3-oxoacyl-[acyl-carrier-protein] reductase [Myxococcales bacterium]USN50085.1 MAG: 3-oxoacyl-[acyl-carrier-protein] reductase [Myxococcales bacterium]